MGTRRQSDAVLSCKRHHAWDIGLSEGRKVTVREEVCSREPI